jgi:FkbM family methyltransferase
VGDRVDTFLKLGSRVVAIEPQSRCIRYLMLRFGKNNRVKIVQKGLDEQVGDRVLYLNRESSMSSMSTVQIVRNTSRPMFSKDRWDRAVTVPVTTLDQLIDTYGDPAFCKIDVEGFEFQVLKGLSRSVKALSYEYTPENIGNAISCIDRLDAL